MFYSLRFSIPPSELFADFHRKSCLIAFDRPGLWCQRVFAYKYLTQLNDKWGSETMKWPSAFRGTARLSSLTQHLHLPRPPPMQRRSWHKNPYRGRKSTESTQVWKNNLGRGAGRTSKFMGFFTSKFLLNFQTNYYKYIFI